MVSKQFSPMNMTESTVEAANIKMILEHLVLSESLKERRKKEKA